MPMKAIMALWLIHWDLQTQRRELKIQRAVEYF